MAAPLESPPMSPGGPSSPAAFRMVETIYIDPDFKPIIKNKNIKTFLTNVIKNVNIQRGRISKAQLIEIDGQRFLLRTTPYETYLQRTKALKEISIYKHLKSDPDYTRFISNLLYADAHLAAGEKESYFIFAYEPGESLSRYIERNKGALSSKQIIDIYNYLNDAIDFLSKKGVVHKDIKPDNIYFSTVRNIPILFDFDVSCIVGVDCDAVEFEGSPQYATPNSKTIRQQEGFGASFKIYRYSPVYDKFSLAKMLENDLSKMASSEEEKEELKAYAKAQQTIFLAQNKNQQSTGGMRRNKTGKLHGGSCGAGTCQLPPQMGGMRIGLMNPTYGGKKRGKTRRVKNKTEALFNLSESLITGGGCGCGVASKQMMELPQGVSLGPITAGLKGGGGCGCRAVPPIPTPLTGGYKATKRNLKYLRLWKKGKSIGFTMRSSLKAKGLIPRSNGTKRVSPKYR